MSDLGWSSDSGSGETYVHPSTHPATMIDVNTTNFPNKKLNIVLEELFQSGNNVKSDVVTALLSKSSGLPINVSSPWASIISAINDLKFGLDTTAGTYELHSADGSKVVTVTATYVAAAKATVQTNGSVRVFSKLSSADYEPYYRIRVDGVFVTPERQHSYYAMVENDVNVSVGSVIELCFSFPGSTKVAVGHFGIGINLSGISVLANAKIL